MANQFFEKIVSTSTRQRMRCVTIKLTIKELELLTSLASDQVFRREFIDPKMPGYKTNPEEIGLGKVIVERLRALLKSGLLDQPNTARIAG
jgi:hypothetical protein